MAWVIASSRKTIPLRRFQENSYSHGGREKSRPYENVGRDGIIAVRRNVAHRAMYFSGKALADFQPGIDEDHTVNQIVIDNRSGFKFQPELDVAGTFLIRSLNL